MRFTLRNVVIRRCRAGCGPPYYLRGSRFDTVFANLNEAKVPSRALCSGGGLVAKARSTVVLESVRFGENRAREGGGAVLVDGAMGVFRDLSFHGNSADSAGALLVTSGSSLDWIGGQATENCARLVESGAVEISESETQAILVGVSVQGSVCRSPATCQREARLGLPTVLVPQRGGKSL